MHCFTEQASEYIEEWESALEFVYTRTEIVPTCFHFTCDWGQVKYRNRQVTVYHEPKMPAKSSPELNHFCMLKRSVNVSFYKILFITRFASVYFTSPMRSIETGRQNTSPCCPGTRGWHGNRTVCQEKG